MSQNTRYWHTRDDPNHISMLISVLPSQSDEARISSKDSRSRSEGIVDSRDSGIHILVLFSGGVLTKLQPSML